MLLEADDLSAGMFWAGMVQGLIDDIQTYREFIDRIIHEAERLLSGMRTGA